jgi:hypothetical protein
MTFKQKFNFPTIFKFIVLNLFFHAIFLQGRAGSYLQHLEQNQTDSLVRYTDLVFNNDFEKQLFIKLLSQKTNLQDTLDMLPFFIAVSPNSDSKFLQKVETVLDELKNDVLKEYNENTPSKNIGKIHTIVHKKILKKYELKNNFVSVFQNGNFNCVSGSALFGLLLQKLKIPFVVKEKPDHVYLLAYPQTHKILLESTDANMGYMSFDEEFIRNYLTYLHKIKVVSEDEIKAANSNNSHRELFDKYFFEDKDINIKQLAGLQYLNQGIYALENEQSAEALTYFAKSYLLYPNAKITYLLEQALLIELSKSKYDTISDVKKYAWLLRFYSQDKTQKDKELFTTEFARMTYLQFTTNGNSALYEQSYQLLKNNVTDSTLFVEIDFMYQYENARSRMAVGRHDDSEPFLQRAYQHKPNHISVKSMLSSSIVQKMAKTEADEKAIEKTKKYMVLYPFLADNEDLYTILCGSYVNVGYKAFANQEGAKGEKMLNEFEALASHKAIPNVLVDYITSAYMEATFYYYRKGNKAKAKQMLQRGLKLAPNSALLKDRLKQLK